MAKMFPLNPPLCGTAKCGARAQWTVTEENGANAQDLCTRHAVPYCRSLSQKEEQPMRIIGDKPKAVKS